jgi:hypothetical protein
VERINSFSFYDLGKTLKAIEALPDGAPAIEAFFALDQARMAMTSLLNGEPIPLGISRDKAKAFQDAIGILFSNRFMVKNDNGESVLQWPEPTSPPVSQWELYWVKHTLTQFEAIFGEEMKETATYFVPRRGIFWTPALVDTADEAFPVSLRGFIPQKTKDDWKAAGRCLAFNLLSASGFHTARAVEGTLEAYFQLFSGEAGKTLRNWNDYIEALERISAAKPDPCPDKKTLAELDQMRLDYRNPIMHPRIVLTEPDARMLFANGESLITAMAQEIAVVRSQGGVQLALTPTTVEAIPSGSEGAEGAGADGSETGEGTEKSFVFSIMKSKESD